MIATVKKFIPRTFKYAIRAAAMKFMQKVFKVSSFSFSQSGEDLILKQYFGEKTDGFFIDIGAFHPLILSNTYYFYSLKNWHGINIDACPGSMKLFDKLRPRDINVEAAISDDNSELTYYFIHSTSPMNSFSKEFLLENKTYEQVKKEIKIKTQSLEQILDEYLPMNTKIDFMNIDAEGVDLKVLRSNNWSKYRPEIVIVEQKIGNVFLIDSTEIYKFLYSEGYEVISVVYQTENLSNVFYSDKESH
ncbi:MAG: FkbM family methyltransferase [Ignavibacteria bacterium]|nr:FkbM family methyltransferase [Ignavibacteria bacterium]